jgi:hypothetical protein
MGTSPLPGTARDETGGVRPPIDDPQALEAVNFAA